MEERQQVEQKIQFPPGKRLNSVLCCPNIIFVGVFTDLRSLINAHIQAQRKSVAVFTPSQFTSP